MDILIGPKEVCQAFNVSRTSMYRMIENGVIPQPASLSGERAKGAKLVWRKSVIEAALDEVMQGAAR